MPFVVIRGSEPVTKLRRKCSSGQTEKTWNSQTGIQLNQTTLMAMKTVSHCVTMVNGMILIVTKLLTSSVKDIFLVNLFLGVELCLISLGHQHFSCAVICIDYIVVVSEASVSAYLLM